MLKCECSSQEYKEIGRLKYQNYRKQVLRVTNKQPLFQLENFSKRGRKGYHLDHILSIKYGFHNNIEPDLIGNIKNLRMIPYKENLQKGEFLEKESFDMFLYFVEQGSL